MCGVSSCGVASGSAGGADSDGVVSGSVEAAESGGVRWCSGVCSSSSNSGGTWLTRLSKSGS